ncbi:MAG: type I-C CRISPR-associated protein Cas7/Csd2 [Acidobacteriaceae bacterium]|nr:type I-C CRISPR-associated protein Cas7/Csd2 [Acidobacteriaceae bacterium]
MSFEKRVEFVLLFDVKDGNPNGDPDAGNAPRVDPENGCGFVTDVCLKRKIRNFVALTKGYEPPNDIYVKERGILAVEQRKAYKALNAEPDSKGPNEKAREWMCANYFDVRAFGAVMTTGKAASDESEANAGSGAKAKTQRKEQKLWNCGQVRGPVQLSFGRSQSRILAMEHAITRVALTNPDDTGRAGSADDEKAASGQMGRKYTVPYALYRAHGFLSPFLAKETGFSQTDYELLLQAIEHMFDNDRSAARGEMAVRGLGVFEHEAPLGNAPSHKLFDLIQIEGPESPRSFAKYKVTQTPATPEGVAFRWIVPPNDDVH